MTSKNNLFLAIILAIALVFGMALIGCDDGSGDDGTGGSGGTGGGGTTTASFAGTWNASGNRSITFTGNNFNYKVNGTTQYQGTFSVSGSTITFNESSLGTASGNFTLSGSTLTLSNHTWDSSVNGTYTKEGGGGGGGTLTITDIPAKYNGKYAFFINEYNPSLFGGQSLNLSTEIGTLVQIANGKVILPMWKIADDFSSISSYSGNDTFTGNNTCYVGIFNTTTAKIELPSDTMLAVINYKGKSFTFSNGSATKPVNDGTLTERDTGGGGGGGGGGSISGGPGLYVGGTYSVTGSTTEIPCYWKDGVRIDLPEGSAIPYRKAFAVNGTDLYILGSYKGDANDRAHYYKNGEKVELSDIRSRAFAITVVGSDVYVAGDYNDGTFKPCYWKNGTKTDLSYSPSFIAVSGTDVYTAGTYLTGSLPDIRTLNWYSKNNGTRTNVTALENGANVFTVVGSDIYFAGEHFTNNGNLAYTWKNGTITNLLTSGSSEVYDIAVVGTTVYSVGYYENSSYERMPCYWTGTTRTALTAAASSQARAITVAGSDVYIAGFDRSGADGYGRACYWKNGTRTSLSTDVSSAYTIVMVQ